jgi:2-hydroxy-6-oxonona-2,4-dienedioate hydrolase
MSVLRQQPRDIPMKMTDINGFNIRYLDYNNVMQISYKTKVLLLLHGIGDSAETWLSVVPALSKYFRLIIPDIIGFGYSDKPTVEYTIDFFLEFLQKFLDNLNIQVVSIVGSSFGGWMATEFAIRFNKRTDRLVLAAPAGMMLSSTHALDQFIMAALYPTRENVLNALINMAYDPSHFTEDMVIDFMNRMRLPNAKYAFMSTLWGIRESPILPDRLSKILVPTLFVWGENDNLIPMKYSVDYRRVPNSKIVIIRECGHMPYIEKPAEFNKAILNFLIQEG